MTDTPETDKAERMAFSSEYMVPTEFARQLERERDDALSQIYQAESRAERFCQERDEAREEAERLRESLRCLLNPQCEAEESK